jgi:hypothetical protein
MPAHAPPPVTVCAYDATKTQRPNALGMRAYLSLVSNDDVTYVVYQHFQEPMGFTDARAWLETRKTLHFHAMKLSEVRALLKRDPRYISELTGNKTAYSAIDATLTCRKDGHSLMEILKNE